MTRTNECEEPAPHGHTLFQIGEDNRPALGKRREELRAHTRHVDGQAIEPEVDGAPHVARVGLTISCDEPAISFRGSDALVRGCAVWRIRNHVIHLADRLHHFEAVPVMHRPGAARFDHGHPAFPSDIGEPDQLADHARPRGPRIAVVALSEQNVELAQSLTIETDLNRLRFYFCHTFAIHTTYA
jgi:hypothetical protein